MHEVKSFNWQSGGDCRGLELRDTAMALTKEQTPAIAFSCKDHGADAGEIAPTLRSMGHTGSHANGGGQVAIAMGADVAHTLRAAGFDASEDGTGRGTPLVPCGIDGGETAFALRATASHSGDKGDGGMNATTVATGMAVRRLTPRECERLQGFPDDWTLIQYRNKPAEQCPDGPRYKALGNSMAVPCMAWIGRRLAAVDALTKGLSQ